MFTFGVPLHGKSPYVKSLLLVEKKQDFVIRVVLRSFFIPMTFFGDLEICCFLNW